MVISIDLRDIFTVCWRKIEDLLDTIILGGNIEVNYLLDDLDTICMALVYGMDPNAEDCRGNFGIIDVVGWNKIDIVRLLLHYGMDPNAEDWRGNSALWYSISTKNIELIKLLFDNGAKVNNKNASSLYYSLLDQDEAIVRLFLERGLDPNVIFPSGSSPLIFALDMEDGNMIRLLLEFGADLDYPNEHGSHDKEINKLIDQYRQKH